MLVGRGPARDVVDAVGRATRASAGLPDPERVLHVIADLVRPLVGKHYVALGIVGPDGAMERIITSGIGSEGPSGAEPRFPRVKL